MISKVIKVFTIDEIVGDLKFHLKYKMPFSLIRFGDGGVKFLHALFYHDEDQLDFISKREGMPREHFGYILEQWSKFARASNYIDYPAIYYTRRFWGKIKKPTKPIAEKTVIRMKMWRDLYMRAEFDNNNFCNPEINYLLCLNRFNDKPNLLHLMEGKKICCITTREELSKCMPDYDITVCKIVSHFENQYENSFKVVMKHIQKNHAKFDLWLVAAGELGRLYTGTLKSLGAVVLDIGYIADYWCTTILPTRIENFMEPNPENSKELILTESGKRFDQFI